MEGGTVARRCIATAGFRENSPAKFTTYNAPAYSHGLLDSRTISALLCSFVRGAVHAYRNC